MDQQARVGAARHDLVDDLVERHLAVAEAADAHAQDEEGRRQLAGHRDLDVAQVGLAELLARDHDRPVARAH